MPSQQGILARNRNIVSEVSSLANAQHAWRAVCLPLMCSENVMSPSAREVMASDLHHRYANSHGDGIFIGSKYSEEREQISTELAQRLFGAKYVARSATWRLMD